MKNWLPFTRSMLLYRLPRQQDARETELFARYTTISVALDEEVEVLIESRLLACDRVEC